MTKVQLKTDKPIFDGSADNKINQLAVYNENLKQEIAFRLSTLSKRIDTLQAAISKLQGGTQ